MTRLSTRLFACSFTLLSLSVSCASAKDYVVGNIEQYRNALSTLSPGDAVVLQNGVWEDVDMLFKGQGESGAPITLKAQTAGEVIFSGESSLRLAGQHLVVRDLVFKDGYSPRSAVVEFRENDDNLAFHSRVTNIVIDNYSNPDKQESDYWVAMYGQHNRLDHSHFAGKTNKGVTVAVRLTSADSQQNQHKIDHNYFGYRPIFGSNGGETLRIGTSHHSLTDSLTVVENNYFDRTNGEVEIISVKSGKNTLRGNVFHEARGTLTLRHGNNNLIENNIFIGNKQDHTGGIRVINKGQTVRNNYLQGLTGYRFGSGFAIMNGVPDSPINRYHQVENATVTNNSFINVEHIQLAVGSDQERSAPPASSTFANNLIVNDTSVGPFTLFDDVSGITFDGNTANVDVPAPLKDGVNIQSVSLEQHSNGLLYPKTETSTGVSRELTVLDKRDTGVPWYPKTFPVVAFDSADTVRVNASYSAIERAIEAASAGDIIEIQAGDLTIPSVLYIDKPLTIRSVKGATVSLAFERSTLFEIKDGGSLKLEGLHISGAKSPDTHSNSVVRTQKWGMSSNYRFEVYNSLITDLNVNHSFQFFTSGKGAFADRIIIDNIAFSDVSGDILKLDKEHEDLGIYNAEYVTLTSNQFTNITGAITRLYRGGTDESTFGPHFILKNNTLRDVGQGKRTTPSASVLLHGVQVASLANNTFENCAPVIVNHTVGEPQTRIIANQFTDTPSPQITELNAAPPHTATLRDNKGI
ncbi:polysaccharide lyase 6 family protein [Alteromonas halophila]|nr:polysaccharide lyase 6 family protein [Alteromonas halophila]